MIHQRLPEDFLMVASGFHLTSCETHTNLIGSRLSIFIINFEEFHTEY